MATDQMKSSLTKTMISIDDFMRYKPLNSDMLPTLIDFYNVNKYKFNRPNNHNSGNHNNWKKLSPIDSKPPDNWLLNNESIQTDDEKLYSQIRSILNKLSDGNFNSLAKELIALKIINAEHLTKLTEFIFNKAIIEPKFAKMYAKLAKELEKFSIKDNTGTFYFRELLIKKCQKMFNDCISLNIQPIELSHDSPSLESEFEKTMQELVITKEMSIGCLTFIGELYLCDLLTSKIINSCFLLLLIKINNNKSHIVECIYTLMKIVNEKFTKNYPIESTLIYDKIIKLIKSDILQTKDKFRLMDIIEMKKI